MEKKKIKNKITGILTSKFYEKLDKDCPKTGFFDIPKEKQRNNTMVCSTFL